MPGSTLMGNIGMALVLYKGGILVMTEVINIGEFVAFITYMYMLIWPMMAKEREAPTPRKKVRRGRCQDLRFMIYLLWNVLLATIR